MNEPLLGNEPNSTWSAEAIARAASMFSAAGDPTRLSLLVRLGQGEAGVSELAEERGVALSTLSQQLKLLHSARLLSRRRAGKHVYYALADDHVAALVQSALEHASE